MRHVKIKWDEAWMGFCSDGMALVHVYPKAERLFHEVRNGAAGCRCEPVIDFMHNGNGEKTIRIARHQAVN